MLEIYFDGACEPVNPGGTASYGWVIGRDGHIIAQDGQIIGSGDGMTNNVAEYTGLIESLKALSNLGITSGEIRIHGDSDLVCKMVSKKWGWKKNQWLPHKDAPHLKALLETVLALLKPYEYEIEWIPGEKNLAADRLSREVLVKSGAVNVGPEVKRCPLCSSKLVVRKGRFGKFYGCSHYPQCKFTENIRELA
jgi:ribonuclease HI